MGMPLARIGPLKVKTVSLVAQGAATIWTMSNMPLKGWIKGYWLLLGAGAGTTINPQIYSSARAAITTQPGAAASHNVPELSIPFTSVNGNLILKPTCDAGADNVVTGEIFYVEDI